MRDCARQEKEFGMMRKLSSGLLVLLAVMVAACGGGGNRGPAPIPPPSGLTYGSVPAFTINKAITPLTPTVVGAVTSYSVTPALPAGLSLDTTTGMISGTPT